MKVLGFLALVWIVVGLINTAVGDETEGAIYIVGAGLLSGFMALLNEMRRM